MKTSLKPYLNIGFLLIIQIPLLIGQDLEVAGEVKIGQMDKSNSVDSVVVRLADGTLGVRDVNWPLEYQAISISNDTIFLSNGGYLKLPGSQFFYLDKDGDTYGDSLYLVYSPSAPPNYVSNDQDCDDGNSDNKPGGQEVCDGMDNDCDGMIDEGYNLMTDSNNCGTCGNQCNLDNATSYCDSGICVIDQCAPGYADCDGNPENGCEVDISSNSNHCGGCNQACPEGQSCVDSSCS